MKARAGDVVAAEYDLLPLAEEGYLPAMLELGRLYGLRDSQAALKKAAYWYRAAIKQDPTADVLLARILLRLGGLDNTDQAKKILLIAYERDDPRAVVALIDFVTDHPGQYPARTVSSFIRKAENIGSEETGPALMRWYRKNAATQLIPHCIRVKDRLPECYVEMARQAREAGTLGKLRELCSDARTRYLAGQISLSLLMRVADVLVSQSVNAKPVPEWAYFLLRELNIPDSTLKIRVAHLLMRYPDLDPNGHPEKLLSDAVSYGSSEAMLQLGLLYMRGQHAPADPVKAESYLQRAALILPEAHYFLGWFYKRGYLGDADPVRAAEHFLIAARHGYTGADDALAEFFSDQRGVRVNPVYAFVFSKLAASYGIADSQKRLDRLKAQMSQKDQEKAHHLFLQEKAARQENPFVPPMPRDEPDREIHFKLKTSETIEETQSGEGIQYLSLDGESLFSARLTPNLTSHLRAQVFLSEPHGKPSATGRPSNRFVALRELWVEQNGPTRYPGETFRLGLQRVRGLDGLWWDKEIESARWIFNTTRIQAHIGVAEQMSRYRSDHPISSLKDRTYFLTGVSHQWRPRHIAGIRGTGAVDHAPLPALGSRVKSSSPRENRKLNWLSVYAENGFYRDRPDAISYWIEATRLVGNETVLQVDATNQVTGVAHRDIASHAFDVGLRVKLPVTLPLQVGITGAYARGGGDSHQSRLFVQTGLQSNRSRFTGTESILNRFNEILRADLSNIRVATVFFSLPLLQGDASLVLSDFERVDRFSPVTTADLSLPLLTDSRQIGHGVDLVLTRHLNKTALESVWDDDSRTSVRLLASLFQPGSAYGHQVDPLYKMIVEVTWWF